MPHVTSTGLSPIFSSRSGNMAPRPFPSEFFFNILGSPVIEDFMSQVHIGNGPAGLDIVEDYRESVAGALRDSYIARDHGVEDLVPEMASHLFDDPVGKTV